MHNNLCRNTNSYNTNSYIDKMFCTYCKKCSSNPHRCSLCDKHMFGRKTINAYTPTIPPRVGYSYINSLLPNQYPYVYYYGSYKNKLINY